MNRHVFDLTVFVRNRPRFSRNHTGDGKRCSRVALEPRGERIDADSKQIAHRLRLTRCGIVRRTCKCLVLAEECGRVGDSKHIPITA